MGDCDWRIIKGASELRNLLLASTRKQKKKSSIHKYLRVSLEILSHYRQITVSLCVFFAYSYCFC
jgi:hypothetical protein